MFSCDKNGRPYCTSCRSPMVRATKYDRGELWNRRIAFKCETCPQLMTIAVGTRERTSAKARAPSPRLIAPIHGLDAGREPGAIPPHFIGAVFELSDR